MQTLSSLFNLPTTTTGFKSLLWTTKGKDLVESGNLSASFNQSPIQITYGDQTYTISPAVIIARSLFEALKNEISMTDLLSLMQSGYLSTVQQKIAEINPINPPKQSAESFKSSSIASAYLNPTAIYDLLSSLNEKTTKAEFLDLIDSIKSIIFPESAEAEYKNLLTLEHEELTRFADLQSIGLFEITQTDNTISAKINLPDFMKLSSKLDTSAYSLSENFQMNGEIININLTRIKP